MSIKKPRESLVSSSMTENREKNYGVSVETCAQKKWKKGFASSL